MIGIEADVDDVVLDGDPLVLAIFSAIEIPSHSQPHLTHSDPQPSILHFERLHLQLDIVRYKCWRNSVNINVILKIKTDSKFNLTIRIDSASFIDQSPNPDLGDFLGSTFLVPLARETSVKNEYLVCNDFPPRLSLN